jgi:nitroimidazol reductase NimA-like FMN-containing flavoprotein (pyridoxamine 5'-phosphate oxidase superfamily)
MSETEIALATLTADECRALLVTHRPRLGRLAFVAGEWPLVLPVNFVLEGDVLYFRSAAGSKLAAAARGDRVAFEIDHVDEVWEEGWSLLAFGHLREVEDPAELARVRQLPLRPWASGDKPYYLRLEILSLSGRRIAYLG